MTPSVGLAVRLVLSLLIVVLGSIGMMWLAGAGPEALLLYLFVAGGPLAGYILLMRTGPGTWVTGIALIGAAVITQLHADVAFELGSSTAGLVYLEFPIYGFGIVVVGVAVERIVLALRRARRAHTTVDASILASVISG